MKASAIVILLLGSGDIESNPGPVQYPCTVCEKYLKRNQCGIMCDGCSHWTHAHCDGVGEAEYLLLTTQQSSEWFCPLSLLSISSLSLWSWTLHLRYYNQIIDEVTTTLTAIKHPGVSKSFQHVHNENNAKKLSAKDKNYYERHKARIQWNRK